MPFMKQKRKVYIIPVKENSSPEYFLYLTDYDLYLNNAVDKTEGKCYTWKKG